ncbi:type I-E CRISPR-associated protein Cse2/CasB [Streptomyces sp. NPDC093675]|uniref:type I-E CRISPR-associated protein Cse2/CasB n=1 Tax=Streptomyces sp. NPDC093675 TaxID=3366049 RepID=UPI00380242EF
MPTTVQRRAHYDDFVTQVIRLCASNRIRADLASGRGRPVAECARMPEHLTRHVARFGARRAHYTVASLIAMQRDLPRQDGPYTPESAARTGGRGTDGDSYTRPATTAATTGDPAPLPLPDAPPDGAPETGGGAGAQPWRARPDLGASLAVAVARHGFKESRMTDRVRTLTKLGTPLLHPRLWSLATHLHSRNAARLDFAVLLEDLAWWDDDQPETAARWRESYFTALDALTASPKED